MGWVRAAAGVAVTLTVAGCGLWATSAKSTTESFYKALGDGNSGEACKLIGPGANRQVLGPMAVGGDQKAAAARGDCSGFVKALSSKRRTLFGTVIADPSPGSGGKNLTARFVTEDKNPVIPYWVRLNKVKDDWRIVSINSGGAP